MVAELISLSVDLKKLASCVEGVWREAALGCIMVFLRWFVVVVPRRGKGQYGVLVRGFKLP